MLTVVHDDSEPHATSGTEAGSSLPDEIVRDGARQMLAAALQAEAAASIAAHAHEVDEHGHRPVVRNGYHWRAVNAAHLVALIRADATVENGVLVERPDESTSGDTHAA